MSAIQDLIDSRGLRAVFQPVVELDGGAIVGYEALVRGPAGSDLEFPGTLFEAARGAGRLVELDRCSRATAIEVALDHGLPEPQSLFLNAEPETLALDVLTRNAGISDRAVADLRPVVEVTERALSERPAELVHAVSELRERGIGIALDDVGADPRSLAFMPLLRPDVIKLDMSVVQSPPTADTYEVVTAVQAHAERTGAAVLAEGVETEEHLHQARSFGATLAQGYFFGRPGELGSGDGEPTPGSLPRLLMPGTNAATTPLALIGEAGDLRTATFELMTAIGTTFERHASRLGESGILLACIPHATWMTDGNLIHWAELSSRLAFAGIMGPDMKREPAPGVRGAAIERSDPVARELSMVALGPHFAAATAGRDLTGSGPLAERRFEFGVTYERSVAIAAARCLIARIGRAA
ncbi:MAG: hypothetical protein QOG62_2064 [Thermoleophilaceae bacterium]|jgi:EAL domain-containing protein (putative c-di-GMP-specific phosphodiesterase class I)|nr:hypothetical protein [Thermoleophilaceae bacterium]